MKVQNLAKMSTNEINKLCIKADQKNRFAVINIKNNRYNGKKILFAKDLKKYFPTLVHWLVFLLKCILEIRFEVRHGDNIIRSVNNQ